MARTGACGPQRHYCPGACCTVDICKTDQSATSPSASTINGATYIRLSVTLTLLAWRAATRRSACWLRANQSSRSTRASTRGARSASCRNVRRSDAVTSGGSNCRVSTGSIRGLCREIRSKAGRRSEGAAGDVGCRNIFRRVRKTPCGSGSVWYARLQYL